jgi:hypothetical protein
MLDGTNDGGNGHRSFDNKLMKLTNSLNMQPVQAEENNR